VQDLLVSSSAILSNGKVADERVFRRFGREVEGFEVHARDPS